MKLRKRNSRQLNKQKQERLRDSQKLEEDTDKALRADFVLQRYVNREREKGTYVPPVPDPDPPRSPSPERYYSMFDDED